MNTETEHAWTREQMATALADGLRGDDHARFDAHLDACASCSEDFAEMKRREADLVALFADARPAPGFEDRLIRNLRQTKPPRTWVHPMVRRAAVGVAATLVLASAGYVVTSASNGGRLPDLIAIADRVKASSNLKSIGLGHLLYSNENRGAYPRTDVFTAPSSNAMKDSYGVGANIDKSNFTQLSKNLSYNYQHPYPAPGAVGSGFKLNESVSAEFDARPDVNSKSDAGGTWLRNRQPGQRSDDGREKNDVLRRHTNLADASQERAGKDLRGAQPAKPGDQAAAGEKPVTEYFLEGNIRRSGGATAANQAKPESAGPAKPEGGSVGQRGEEAKSASADWKFGRSATPLESFKPTQLGLEVAQVDQVKTLNGGVIIGDQLKVKETREVALQAGRQGQQQDNQQAAPIAGAVVPTEPPPPSQLQPPPQPPQAGPSRKVIRTGVMEFEVDRFDAALAMITKLTQEAGGYVGTTDSEKLPNGKVKGTVTVRVPPDRLDTLVLQLRGIGDLRSQKMDAQDVTKQYTDLEGELRAARAMEERLLEIIKTGQGQIKDLLAAEKELGVWRTKIEKMVGEMRYYDNLVSLTTLTITAFERDIRTAATSKETETVQAGIETDDVEGARTAALKAIDEAKGRVIQSDLKRHDAGQFSAQVVADVGPDAAGPLVDRLKQLGKVARFEVQRKQTTPEGTTQPAPGARLERAETRIHLSLYNLANVAPRQTTNLNLAAVDAEAAYKAIAARVEKAGGRVVKSDLTRPQPDRIEGSIHFEVKTADGEAVLGDVRALGEVMRLTVTENPDTNNVTTAKQGFVVQIASVAAVQAREATTIEIAAADVPVAYGALRDAVRATPTNRVTQAQLNDAERANVTALLDFEVMREDLPTVEDTLKKLGDVAGRSSARSGDTENTVDSKVRFTVRLVDADQLPPRETTEIGIETSDPEKALADLQLDAAAAGGRVIHSNLSQERGGQTSGKLVVDVPLAKSMELITRAKGQGTVRWVQSTKDAQVPDGSLARARVDMTFGTSAGIVSPEQGLWSTIRRGLATSMTGLMWSLQLIIIGLCFVGPWVLLILLGWKLLRRKKSTPAPVPA